MKRIILIASIITFTIFIIVSCKKNFRPSEPIAPTMHNNSGINYNELCKGYVEALQKKTRTQITVDSAITQMEGASNYTYARLYKYWSNRFYFKDIYELTLDGNGKVSSTDVSTMYAQVISDLGDFRDDVEQHENNIWLAMVDFKRVSSTNGVIEVSAIFLDVDINFDPEELTQEYIWTNYYKSVSPQSFENGQDGMCSGTAGFNMPFQASASSAGVLHFGDLKWNLYNNPGVFNQYSPTIVTGDIHSCIIDQTNLFHGTATCMNHTTVNTYVGLQTSATAVSHTFGGLSTDKVYLGQSHPATYLINTDCNGDFPTNEIIWESGSYYFGNWTAATQAVINL